MDNSELRVARTRICTLTHTIQSGIKKQHWVVEKQILAI